MCSQDIKRASSGRREKGWRSDSNPEMASPSINVMFNRQNGDPRRMGSGVNICSRMGLWPDRLASRTCCCVRCVYGEDS